MNASKKFHSMGKWLFWASVIVSGIVGVKGIRLLPTSVEYAIITSPLGRYPFLFGYIINPLMAILCFLILYRFLSFILIASVEKRKGIEINKPNVVRGIVYCISIQLIWVILNLLMFYLIAHSGMHDSM